jgi:hypothetical protein
MKNAMAEEARERAMCFPSFCKVNAGALACAHLTLLSIFSYNILKVRIEKMMTAIKTAFSEQKVCQNTYPPPPHFCTYFAFF